MFKTLWLVKFASRLWKVPSGWQFRRWKLLATRTEVAGKQLCFLTIEGASIGAHRFHHDLFRQTRDATGTDSWPMKGEDERGRWFWPEESAG